MKNKLMYGFVFLTLVLSVAGFSKLLNSVENGKASANEFLGAKMGGSMNTDEFLLMTEGYIQSNIILGAIMLMVGLSFFCFSLYTILKNFK
ncbi:hypothetical protein [Pseudoneobacillus sp. C159]